MSKNQYAVVYGGQFMKGFSRDEATRQFALLYRIDVDRAAELLSRRHLVLKHGLPEKLARRYQKAYADAGVVTQIQIQRLAAGPTRHDASEPDTRHGDPAATSIMPATAGGTSLMSSVDEPSTQRLEATTIQKVIEFDDDVAFDDGPVFPDPKPDAGTAPKPSGMTRVLHAESAEDFDRIDEEAPASVKAPPAPRPTPRTGDPDSLRADGVPPPAGDGAPPEPGHRVPPPPPPASTPPTPESGRSGEMPAAPGPESYPFVFHGTTGEYFRIWIVNLTLSILTLGIYSAWAKVRNLRYFHGNTEVADGRFEFHGKPTAILIGRIIAVLVFVGYTLLSQFVALLALPLLLVLAAGLPWMVNRALSFRYRNTSYRGLRFGFSGNYLGALKAFVLWPIATALTAGLLFPFAYYAQKRYIVGHASFGRSRFQPAFGAGAFYKVALLALGVLVLGLAAAFVLGLVFKPLAVLALIPAYFLVFAYFQAGTTNLVFNGTTLDRHGFESNLAAGSLAWLHFSNALALALTIGLALPWVKVRMANYRADHLWLNVAEDLDRFVAAEQREVAAVGEELGDVFDVDLGL